MGEPVRYAADAVSAKMGNELLPSRYVSMSVEPLSSGFRVFGFVGALGVFLQHTKPLSLQ